MARIRPFRAWTYAREDADVTALTAPPYDVISPEQRAELLTQSEHNVVALELPDGPLDPSSESNRYSTGAETWNEWRADGVVVQDSLPTIYALEQRYKIGDKPVSRKAFITEVELHAFDEGIILPHERTLPKALGDRFELTKATDANFSQVFGLYEDAEQATASLFAEAMAGEPTLTSMDADNVESIVYAITDSTLIERIQAALLNSRIFIADGHHRYTVALAYRDLRRELAEREGDDPVDPDFNYVMMALVNMDDPDLVVLPTHRVADHSDTFDADQFWTGISANFIVSDPADLHHALDHLAKPAFLIKTRADSSPRLAVLRDGIDLDEAIQTQHSSAWKHLDVAVLLELVLDPLLNIHPDRAETLDRLSFVKNAHDAMSATADHDVAFMLRATGMDQLRRVSLAGDVMPQKSTYFYPKLLSGLVMRGMD